MITLPPDELHLWWADVDETIDPVVQAQAFALMSPEERHQHERYVFAKDRRRYLVTRTLVRTVLSRYLPVAPAQWAFQASEYGRPMIVNPPALDAQLHFNISHTDRFVVLALSKGRELGVDTENTDRQAPLNVARGCFSPLEIDALSRLRPDEQLMRFWELWTFKESYIKARGKGLSLPLDSFSIVLPIDGRVGLEVDASLADASPRWQLWQLQPSPSQLVALCVQAFDGLPPRLVCRHSRPLKDDSLAEAIITRRPLHTAHA